MDPKTIQLIVYLEQLAALVAKGVADLRGVVSGASGKDTATILADADAGYQQLIANDRGQFPADPGKGGGQ